MITTPWWSETTGTLIGSLGGAGLGTLGGLLGAAIGVCAQRGVGKGLIVGLQVFFASLGAAMLVAGLAGIFMGQPRFVYYPVTLLGSLMAGVLGGLIPVTLTGYGLSEARRSVSGDRSIADGSTGLAASGPIMQAFVNMWGDTGPQRRCSLLGASCAGLLTLLALAALALSWAGMLPSEQWMAWGQLAFIMGIMATTLGILAISMGRRAKGFEQVLDQQRLAAEELRRS